MSTGVCAGRAPVRSGGRSGEDTTTRSSTVRDHAGGRRATRRGSAAGSANNCTSKGRIENKTRCRTISVSGPPHPIDWVTFDWAPNQKPRSPILNSVAPAQVRKMRRPTRDRRSKAEKAAAAAAANNKGATDHITASGDTEEVRIYIVFGVIVSCLCLCMHSLVGTSCVCVWVRVCL